MYVRGTLRKSVVFEAITTRYGFSGRISRAPIVNRVRLFRLIAEHYRFTIFDYGCRFARILFVQTNRSGADTVVGARRTFWKTPKGFFYRRERKPS